MKDNNNNLNLGNIPNLNITLSNTNNSKEINSEKESQPLLASHKKDRGYSKKYRNKYGLTRKLKHMLRTLKHKAYHKYKSLRSRKTKQHYRPHVSLLNRLGAHTYRAKRQLLKRLATLRSQKRKPKKNNWLVNWNKYNNV